MIQYRKRPYNFGIWKTANLVLVPVDAVSAEVQVHLADEQLHGDVAGEPP